ncbi:uncharacterized protein BO88DRAFT_400772 [Aspergillus vadensis CBS 113365]|uniref:Uncharacterized protein n=1 Tax=Aspergillus vadensis (strain CBS 113365 / IMI 142717 / IBT 24658) TaxID=1448311 RepID=A0A319BR59_ASPVC|nr:hypothetical protein BO88DRAFT_400772 [Aspergillus vadensis CBS 113365]PYH75185.1 hypothetical protein BO88DRAFT_400772 [Aspergillus vadensis CBS 113365]
MIFLLPCERSSLSVATTAYDVELEPVLLTGEKPSSQPPQFHSQLIGFRFESSGTNVPKIPEALDSIRWKWQPRSSWDSDANTIAQQLIDESERYFPLVQFEDWVQEARDRSSPIVKALESKYDGLSVILYYYLRRHLNEFEKYLGLTNTLEKFTADPFLSGAVYHACECVCNRRYTEYNIDARFITDPIKAVLSKDNPIALIHCQLEALAVRFRNFYRSPEVVCSQDFNTQTAFLDKLYHTELEELEALAAELTAAALSLFQELTVEMVKKGSGDPLTALNRWWNSICRAAEECSATEPALYLKLDQLALKFYRLRDFYSFTGLLQGIRLSGRRPEVLRTLGHLIDSGENYRLYRQNIDSDATLHFLLPFVKLQSQESTATLQIVSAAQKYALRNTSNKASQRLLSFLIPLCFCV